MGIVHLPDELQHVIDRQIEEGRAASEAEFLADAVTRHAEALEAGEQEMRAAIDEGLADIAAGRFELIATEEDMERLQDRWEAMIGAAARSSERLTPS